MSYRKWISVKLGHSYFADGRCPAMRFEPTDDCREQLRRRGQYFFAIPNGFYIFQDTGKIKEDQSGNPESSFFDIAVYPGDVLFANYSNLEIDYRQGKIYYIGNTLESSVDESKGKTLTLTDREGGQEKEAVPVILEPKQFVISLDQAAPGDTFKLLDKKNSVVKEQRIAGNTDGAALYADVRGKSAGIYYLQRNNEISACFYADDSLYNNKPAFIIGIEAVYPGNREEGDATVQNYDIRAASRGVSWEYHVIARANGRKLKNLEIRNNNEKLLPGISFEQVSIDEERNEAVFISNKTVPLSERAYQSIELIEKGNNGTPLVPHLPNADISSLHVQEGKWMSQIYVYI